MSTTTICSFGAVKDWKAKIAQELQTGHTNGKLPPLHEKNTFSIYLFKTFSANVTLNKMFVIRF